MLNPDEDTEWNDILRQHGILPPKKVIPEEAPPSPPDTVSVLDQLDSEQLAERLDLAEDGGVDEEEAKFLEEYRRKRIAMLQAEATKAKFGAVRDISKTDWKTEVNDVDPDVYVVIHIAQRGHFLCTMIDSHIHELAGKFPKVKFLRGESALCIPDYPERNLPSLLIYKAGDLVHQLIGPAAVGGKSLTVKGLEWRLAQMDVLKTKLTEDPSKRIQVNAKSGRIGGGWRGDDDSDSD